MAVGKVKWWNDQKGYGFVTPDGAEVGRDAFVHYSAIKSEGFKTLTEGQRVEFELVTTPKGDKAINVTTL